MVVYKGLYLVTYMTTKVVCALPYAVFLSFQSLRLSCFQPRHLSRMQGLWYGERPTIQVATPSEKAKFKSDF